MAKKRITSVDVARKAGVAQFMGVTHAEFGPWGLRREYTLFDETAVWKQIVLATG